MKSKTLGMIFLSQFVVLLLFLLLTIGNEIFNLPNLVFNYQLTTLPQRQGEIVIEVLIFIVVLTVQWGLLRSLYGRIRVLEGFIPICANCKRIRNDKELWEEMEKYITDHSLATFSHGICPDCMKELYPDMSHN